MIVETTQNLNRRSYAVPIAMAELLLAFLLYFYPDFAKIFLFGLPLVLFFGESIELIIKYFKNKEKILHLIGGILLLICGIATTFAERKTFMLGIAMLMAFETVRFSVCGRNENCKLLEKLIYIGAALLSFCWMLLILFKGLHLYWSVREYLALYFIGTALLSVLRKR